MSSLSLTCQNEEWNICAKQHLAISLLWVLYDTCVTHLTAVVCLPLSSSSLCSLENIFCSLPPPEAHDGQGVWRVRMLVAACNEMWRPALTATLVKLHRRSILTSLYVASPAASAYGSINANFSISCLLDTKSNLSITSCQNMKPHLAKPAASCWFS